MSPLPRHLLRDEPLARLAASGDRGAFEVLFGRHRGALLRCARSIVRNDHDAQDAVQSTALKALAGLARRRDGVPFTPWLFRIAYNESISILRLRRARPAQELEQTLAHPEPGPAQRTLDRADLRELIDDLTHLTEAQRTALLLRQLSGCSYDEIARVLHTTPVAARRSVATARGNLAAFAAGRDAGCAGVQLTLDAGDRRAMRALAVRAHLRACEACRAQARRPGRGARAASFVPVPIAQLLSALRDALAPVGAGLPDGVAAPTAKALAVAAALTAGVGVGASGIAHRLRAPDDTPTAVAQARPAARAPAHHHAHHVHAASTPAPATTPAPVVHHIAVPAPAHHTISAPAHHAHRALAVYRPTATATRTPAVEPIESVHTAPAPAPVVHHRSVPAVHHVAPSPPTADTSPSEPSSAPHDVPVEAPSDPQTPAPSDAPSASDASAHCTPGSPDADTHTDSSHVGPHNGQPGPLS